MTFAGSLLGLFLFAQFDAGTDQARTQACAMESALKAALHLQPALSISSAFQVAAGTPGLNADLDALTSGARFSRRRFDRPGAH